MQCLAKAASWLCEKDSAVQDAVAPQLTGATLPRSWIEVSQMCADAHAEHSNIHFIANSARESLELKMQTWRIVGCEPDYTKTRTEPGSTAS
ncbi:unnamed protein product [Symbiodinium sp. CCMP2592]|nr:unnamed protein product [Symbiodinium sp. CCMP2592]